MADYETMFEDSIDDLKTTIEAIDSTQDISVVALPYWRRDSPRSIAYKYGVMKGVSVGVTDAALDVNIKSSISLGVNIESSDIQQNWDYAGSGVPSSTLSPPAGTIPTYINYANGDVYLYSAGAWRLI